MSNRQQLWWCLGGVMLLAVCYLVSPVSGGALIVVSLTTLAVLWLKGATRIPGLVTQKRREFLRDCPTRAHHDRAVMPREFRYVTQRWVRGCLWLFGVGASLVGSIFLAVSLLKVEARPAVGVGVMALGFGLFMLRFAFRLPHLGVRIGPSGIAVEGIIGRRRIAWDDIVIMTSKQYSVYGGPLQLDYVLYGIDSSLEFSNKLPQIEELLTVLETNLPPAALART